MHQVNCAVVPETCNGSTSRNTHAICKFASVVHNVVNELPCFGLCGCRWQNPGVSIHVRTYRASPDRRPVINQLGWSNKIESKHALIGRRRRFRAATGRALARTHLLHLRLLRHHAGCRRCSWNLGGSPLFFSCVSRRIARIRAALPMSSMAPPRTAMAGGGSRAARENGQAGRWRIGGTAASVGALSGRGCTNVSRARPATTSSYHRA